MLYAYEEGIALRLIAQTPLDTHDLIIDDSYEHLFSFADCDMQPTVDLLLQYFRSRVDVDTMEIREPSSDADISIADLYASLISIHPFFTSSDHATALPDLLAATYNALLIQQDIQLSEEDYKASLHTLVSDATIYCQNQTGYLESYHDQLLMEKRYYDAYTSKRSTCLAITSLISFQKYVRAYLYWVRDASADRFRDLDMTERLRLFRQVFGETNAWQPLRLREYSCIGTPGGKGMRRIIEKGQWRLIQAAVNGSGDFEAIADETEKEKKAELERLSYAKVLIELSSDTEDLDADISRWMKKQITAIKKETSQPLFKAYEISSFTDYILLQLRLLTEKSAIIKRCKNCGQYFITERTNIDYCQRILPGETQTCFVIGPRRVYNKTLSDDVPRNLYAKAYKRYQARLRRKSISDAEFEAWKADAKRYLDDVQNGRIGLEAYTKWMES